MDKLYSKELTTFIQEHNKVGLQYLPTVLLGYVKTPADILSLLIHFKKIDLKYMKKESQQAFKDILQQKWTKLIIEITLHSYTFDPLNSMIVQIIDIENDKGKHHYYTVYEDYQIMKNNCDLLVYHEDQLNCPTLSLEKPEIKKRVQRLKILTHYDKAFVMYLSNQDQEKAMRQRLILKKNQY